MMHRCWRGQVCERAPPATVRRLWRRAPARQAQALLDGCVARNALRVPFQPRLVVRQANRRQRPCRCGVCYERIDRTSRCTIRLDPGDTRARSLQAAVVPAGDLRLWTCQAFAYFPCFQVKDDRHGVRSEECGHQLRGEVEGRAVASFSPEALGDLLKRALGATAAFLGVIHNINSYHQIQLMCDHNNTCARCVKNISVLHNALTTTWRPIDSLAYCRPHVVRI